MEDPKIERKDGVPERAAGEQPGTIEKIVDEVAQNIKAFTQKVIDHAKTAGGDGAGDAGAHVGSLTIVESKNSTAESRDAAAASEKSEKPFSTDSVLQPLALSETLSADEKGDISRKYESLAKLTLERVHKGISFTTDGSEPKVADYRESVTLPSDVSTEQIARQQLGTKASPEQVNAYTQALVSLNIDRVGFNAAGEEYFSAGTDIRLPGQNAEGAIVYRQEDDGKVKNVKIWNDGSRIDTYVDGSGSARYKDGDTDVSVHWNAKEPRENGEHRTTQVVTDPATGAGHSETRSRFADKQGRSVEHSYQDGKLTSVRITDKYSNVIELAPTASGEFHGRKTNRGRELDSDVWMSRDGRIYARETDTTGKVTRRYEDGSTDLYDQRGRLRERTYKDDKERTFHEVYRPGRKTADSVSITDKDGSTLETRPGKDGLWHGVKKDANGNVVDRDAGISGDGRTFSQTKNGEGMVRTFEDGFVQKFDKRGRLTYTEGKDEQGRQFESTFNPGENNPHTYRLTVEQGKPPIEFTRQNNGKYTGDQLTANGDVIARVEILGAGALLYSDVDGKNPRVVFPDGRMIRQHDMPDGSKHFIETKGSDVHTQQFDPQGRKVLETFMGDGRLLTATTEYSAGKKSAEKITIVDSKGITTLEQNLLTDSFTGTRKPYFGAPEKVAFVDGKLLYRDAKTDQVTGAEQLTRDEGAIVSRAIRLDYQMNHGTVSRDVGNGTTMRETLSPGRTDIVNPNGSISGFRSDGTVSYTGSRGTNEASVIHSHDITGVTLKPDGSIEMWNQNGSRTEQLSAEEKKFLDKNPQADRRDIAEIHRKFSPDQTKIDSFYKALERVDNADKLSAAEKTTLKDNLLWHVAFPDEIYQGRSPTCNVAVLQREMAIDSPARYAEFVAGAAEGTVRTGAGAEVHLNVENLKRADSSGRDLASRIFQTASVNLMLYPGKVFLNTESGVGEVRSIKSEKTSWWSGKRTFEYENDAKTFEGLQIFNIAEVATRLTGENYSPVFVQSAEDLATLYRSNGNRPVTIAVNGKEYPFRQVGPVGQGNGLNHVVTITGIDQGPPLKFQIQNQWGLSQDRSKMTTAIEAEDLMLNMKSGGGTMAMALARVPGGRPRSLQLANVTSSGRVTFDHVCTVVDLGGGKQECK